MNEIELFRPNKQFTAISMTHDKNGFLCWLFIIAFTVNKSLSDNGQEFNSVQNQLLSLDCI